MEINIYLFSILPISHIKRVYCSMLERMNTYTHAHSHICSHMNTNHFGNGWFTRAPFSWPTAFQWGSLVGLVCKTTWNQSCCKNPELKKKKKSIILISSLPLSQQGFRGYMARNQQSEIYSNPMFIRKETLLFPWKCYIPKISII